MIYLDHAASSPMSPEVLRILAESEALDFANPSSSHKYGVALAKRIEKTKASFKTLLGAAENDHFIFTASATESNNTIFRGLDLPSETKVLVPFFDHPSITEPAQDLKRYGIHVEELKFPVAESTLEKQLEGVSLLALSHVNNQTGYIIDIFSMAEKLKRKYPSLHIHIDASQSFTKLPISLKKTAIDSLSLSSHKVGGPKGIAALWVRSGVKIRPLLLGGGQDEGLRSSTLAAPLIFAFEKAALLPRNQTHVMALKEDVKDFFKKEFKNIDFPFEQYTTSPYVMTLIIPGFSSDVFIRHLEMKDIIVSSTSACSSRVRGTNDVFTALNIDERLHKSVLRISFSEQNTKEEIAIFLETFKNIYTELFRLKA